MRHAMIVSFEEETEVSSHAMLIFANKQVIANRNRSKVPAEELGSSPLVFCTASLTQHTRYQELRTYFGRNIRIVHGRHCQLCYRHDKQCDTFTDSGHPTTANEFNFRTPLAGRCQA